MSDQPGAVDLEALKRLRDDEDFIYDLWRPQKPHSNEEFYDRAFNEGIEAARVALVERLKPDAILAALERAERVETAVATITHVAVDEAGSHVHVGLWVNHAKAGNLTLRREEYEVFRAALAAAPEDSGAAFERYLNERFPTPEARAVLDAKVEEVNRTAAPEGSDG